VSILEVCIVNLLKNAEALARIFDWTRRETLMVQKIEQDVMGVDRAE